MFEGLYAVRIAVLRCFAFQTSSLLINIFRRFVSRDATSGALIRDDDELRHHLYGKSTPSTGSKKHAKKCPICSVKIESMLDFKPVRFQYVNLGS